MDLATVGALIEGMSQAATPEVIGGALFKSAAGAPGSLAAAQALKRVFERRTGAAREILLEEIAEKGEMEGLSDEKADDLIAMLWRYHRAANEGAARLNMRLLARIIGGQIEQKALTADEFLYYADTLASLRREEVILIATLKKHQNLVESETPEEREGKEYPPKRAFETAKEELIPRVFPEWEDMLITAYAAMRTGLVSSWDVPLLGGSAVYFRTTKLLSQITRYAQFDQVLERENIRF